MAFLFDLSDLGSADSKNRFNHVAFNVGAAVQAPDGRESRILIRDTWNTDIVKELTPHPMIYASIRIASVAFSKPNLIRD